MERHTIKSIVLSVVSVFLAPAYGIEYFHDDFSTFTGWTYTTASTGQFASSGSYAYLSAGQNVDGDCIAYKPLEIALNPTDDFILTININSGADLSSTCGTVTVTLLDSSDKIVAQINWHDVQASTGYGGVDFYAEGGTTIYRTDPSGNGTVYPTFSGTLMLKRSGSEWSAWVNGTQEGTTLTLSPTLTATMIQIDMGHWKNYNERAIEIDDIAITQNDNDIVFKPPFTRANKNIYPTMYQNNFGSEYVHSFSTIDLNTGDVNQWIFTCAHLVGGGGMAELDDISQSFSVPVTGTYQISFSGTISGAIRSAGLSFYVGTGKEGFVINLTANIGGVNSTQQQLYQTDLSWGAFIDEVVLSDSIQAVADIISSGYSEVEKISEMLDLMDQIGSNIEPQAIWNGNSFTLEMTCDLAAGTPYIWSFYPSAVVSSVALGIADQVAFENINFSLQEVRISRTSLKITKCTLTAGSKPNSDTISIWGTMGPTTDNFNNATAVEVNIDSNDIVNPCVLTFPINDKTFKNGRYSYSGTESGVKKSFTYNLKTGIFTFSAANVDLSGANVDLSGLGCPLTLEIEIGDYIATAEIDEAIVSGSKVPMPIQLMMGVKDVLRVDKCQVKHGKDPNSDQLSVSGAFAVENPNMSMANRFSEGLVITLGTQTFTIPANKLKVGKGTFTCSNANVTEGGIAAVNFNFDTCSFILTIKKTEIPVSSGTVNFCVAFAGYNQCVRITLP
jgi:hypothetical protein